MNNILQHIVTVEISFVDKRKKRNNPGIKPRDVFASTSHVQTKLVNGQQTRVKV